MQRILGIVASPRKLGNSEILAKVIMEATGSNNKMEMIRLTDLNIERCRACYACLPEEASCVIKDDLNFLLERIRLADAVVLASPCYFLGPNSSIKALQDRCLSAGKKCEEYSGKPCVTITTYGRPGWDGYAEAALNLTARFLNLHLVDSASFLGANPAAVLQDPDNLKRAQQMGRALFDPQYKRAPKVNECPVCWSDILRYNGKNVICPFCGTIGDIRLEGEEIKLEFYTKADHRFSDGGRLEHYNFLNGKKHEFLANRNYLKELQAPYRSTGSWLIPDQK